MGGRKGALVTLDTKANTLQRLAPLMTRGRIKPLYWFCTDAWRQNPGAVLTIIDQKFSGRTLIIRSSAATEDQSTVSQAGAHTSVPYVDGDDLEAVRAAIETVLQSYDSPSEGDQVLIQEQLLDSRMSGVLFTRELTSLAPYYVFNYDDQSGATDTVTSGTGSNLKTYLRFRLADAAGIPPGFVSIFAAVQEIESLVDSDRLEIELASDSVGDVWIFQVRAITTSSSPMPSDETVAGYLDKVALKIEKLGCRHPHLLGGETLFGVMPDWNPAEIIGLRPRALALSLYKEIITDSVWAYQRENYGYRNLRSFPLLVSFLGVPFIDVRVSFNSFIPGTITNPLAEKLASYYVRALREDPDKHDRVEFEVIFSCYRPGIREDVRILESNGFTSYEIGELLSSLRALTNRIIDPSQGLYLNDLNRIKELVQRRGTVLESDMSLVDKIYWLLEDCKRYGTLPFSGLARAGFIAVEFLRGFVSTGIFSRDDFDAFMASLNTVANRLSRDMVRLRVGGLSRGAFLEKYGHLRPGTYDVLSPRYDAAFDTYFAELPEASRSYRPFVLTDDQKSRIGQLLQEDGLKISTQDLMAFIRTAIEGREYAKLVFTRSLSDALELIERLGQRCDLSREDVSHLDVRVVLRLYASLDALDLADILLRDIRANQEAHRVTDLVQFPGLICSPEDVYHFHLLPRNPNFVTSRKVLAPVILEDRLERESPSGKIVLIASADPGYDWLLSRGIAGLITMFGGANSHMAIRSAELELPAVIGCGEFYFMRWSRARQLEIDCLNRRVVCIP